MRFKSTPEVFMLKLRALFSAAAAVLVFAAGAFAVEPVLLALNTPAKAELKIPAESKPVQQARPAAAQAKPGYTDFDAVSVTDPLYREGSKAMLKQVIKDEEGSKESAKPVMRDAPISRTSAPAKPLKRPSMKKPLRTDPVKVQNSL
jgi:hypothetical protein